MKFLEKVKQIKHLCDMHKECGECIYNNDGVCSIEKLLRYLASHTPCYWNVKHIEEIMK